MSVLVSVSADFRQCRCRPTFVFSNRLFSDFLWHMKIQNFPHFFVFAQLNERCNHQFTYKNRLNPEMHQKSCLKQIILILTLQSWKKNEKYVKYTKILWCRFEVGVGIGFADISKCRCRPTSKSWSRWITSTTKYSRE